MAGVVSTVFLVLVGVMFMADNSIAYVATGASPTGQYFFSFDGLGYGINTYKQVEGKKVQLRFYFGGKLSTLSPGPGLWKMSAYGSHTNTKYGTPEIYQILTDADSHCSGNSVNFVSKYIELDGVSSCSGDKKFLCFVLFKGSNPLISACMYPKLECPVVSQPATSEQVLVRGEYAIDQNSLVSLPGKRFQFKFFFRGRITSASTGQGLWKMYLSAGESLTNKGTPETGQILTDADSHYSGTSLNFLSKITEMDGLGGCTGDKDYLCMWLYKGNYLVLNGVCDKLDLPCSATSEQVLVDGTFAMDASSLVNLPGKRHQFKCSYRGSVRRGSTAPGLWKMYLSAGFSPTNKGTRGTGQILTDADSQYSGTSLNFLSKITEVDGLGGCTGDKNYLCMWLYKGNYLVLDGLCYKPLIPCYYK